MVAQSTSNASWTMCFHLTTKREYLDCDGRLPAQKHYVGRFHYWDRSHALTLMEVDCMRAICAKSSCHNKEEHG